jgi:hypothetical protein
VAQLIEFAKFIRSVREGASDVSSHFSLVARLEGETKSVVEWLGLEALGTWLWQH